jgi:protein-S-isoprenylcysteine O-methyltransferase Ste14
MPQETRMVDQQTDAPEHSQVVVFPPVIPLTRNPMYLFGSIAYAGLALALVELWSLALLPAVVAVTHSGVVLREKVFLARRFGRAYDQYRARVRRWL